MQNITELFDRSCNALNTCKTILASITNHLASVCGKNETEADKLQLTLYDFAFMASQVQAAEQLREYAGSAGELEKALFCLFAGEVVQDMRMRISARPEEFGMKGSEVETNGMQQTISASMYEHIAEQIKQQGHGGSYGLSEEHEMMRQSFAKAGKTVVEPLAEKIHREDLLIPESIITTLSEMGCFGLTIPEKYGGLQEEIPDNTGMVVVTEELSKASLGAAGSLITRPEILAKALLKGGTEEQKKKWLPMLASGEKMAAVAVTEPDYGSDVAGIKVSAIRTEGGWLLNGVKTWCTFAGRADILMILARTDPDMSKKHKGLSIFIAEKDRYDGYEFEYAQPAGGKISGRAIGTIGYRGMHSFEVVFENAFVPEENLVGGKDGEGKGFYLQMEGFAGGRLQTAARANGVMQASFEKALQYSLERKVFGKPIFDYQLTKYKLARMAALIQASRQVTYFAARLMDRGEGGLEASLCKFFASKVSEWVAREAQQIHGGMGYAEEYAVSRYFVDARVFSIFEGAEEILALKVIAKGLLDRALKQATH